MDRGFEPLNSPAEADHQNDRTHDNCHVKPRDELAQPCPKRDFAEKGPIFEIDRCLSGDSLRFPNRQRPGHKRQHNAQGQRDTQRTE